MTVLVTGGTGRLGRAVDRLLRGAGHDVRVLSRRPTPADRSVTEWATGDLRTGAGVDAGVAGVDVIVHCATSGTGDERATRTLVDAALRAGGSPHLIYVSIVGIDRIPMFYYRAKLACERVVAECGLPWTTLRATQFHDLVAGLFAAQRRLPVTVAPEVSFQPVDVQDVAARLVELASGAASGRVADLGGPAVRTAPALAEAYQRATGRSRRVVRLSLPGRAFAALREGANLVEEGPRGSITFEEYLARRS